MTKVTRNFPSVTTISNMPEIRKLAYHSQEMLRDASQPSNGRYSEWNFNDIYSTYFYLLSLFYQF